MIFNFSQQPHSIGESMAKSLFLLFLLSFSFPSISTAEEFLKWKCKNENCNLYANLYNGEIKLILSNVNIDLANKTTFKKYSNNIAYYHYGCGNNCNYTAFVNLENGEYSQEYYDILAIDIKNKILIIPDPSEDSYKTVLITPIFSNLKKSISITRNNMYHSADISVRANFLQNWEVELDYDISEDDSKTEIITIDYQKLRENLIDKIYKIINFSEKL